MIRKQNSSEDFNVWNYKPWWCQPWSIILTGITIILGSWSIFKILWLSVIVACPIIAWWTYFLVLYPRMVKQMYQTQIDK